MGDMEVDAGAGAEPGPGEQVFWAARCGRAESVSALPPDMY